MSEKIIAFVGNPNVGKSAWINALSGSDFKIGNWPGVTIERKEAITSWHGESYHLIDLPGTYSLDHSDNEENITATFLKEEHVDLIVNILDATNLERNLYLSLLLRELQIPMVMIFNFMDEVEKHGIEIEFNKIARRLQIPILPYSAFDKKHYEIVIGAIEKQAGKSVFYYPLLDHDDYQIFVDLYELVERHLPHYIESSEVMIAQLVHQYLHDDQSVITQMDHWHFPMEKLQEVKGDVNKEYLKRKTYQVISSLMMYVTANKRSRLRLTRKMDHFLLHRILGLPLFFIILGITLMIVFNASAPLTDFVDYFIHDYLFKYISLALAGAPDFISQLLINGILAGVGGVLVFIPLMALLYFALALLEESGYMSRVAFLLDRIMSKFHLSGKSFISLIIGFGCNVPAIYSTRTLDNSKQKKLTALLIPFMSCGARLPVYALFGAAFFGQKAGAMILSIYAIGILLALIMVFIFNRFGEFRDDDLFVLELPPYRTPSMHVIYQKVKQEVKAYIRKAIHVVMWAMIVIWAFTYFPSGDINDSYIVRMSKSVMPIFEPLGFGNRWETIASLPGGIVAKETIVGFMDQVLLTHHDVTPNYNIKDDTALLAKEFGTSIKKSILNIISFGSYEKQDNTLTDAISRLWVDEKAPLRAFSFMVYILLSIPCVMSLQALYREYGKRLLLISLITMITVPYVTSLFIFQFFSLFY